MPAGKQRIITTDDASQVHAAAVEAHLNAKQGEVPKSDELTSLNKLLQWGAAHSDKPAMAGTDVSNLDREWLSALFPDMNAAVKQLLKTLNSELQNGTPDDISQLLQALEEYLSDINYAQNIGPLKVLPPLLTALQHPDSSVRSNALWAVGSALQDMRENCALFEAAGGFQHVVDGLKDEHAAVRLKALRAASAILRAADNDVKNKFRDMAKPNMVALFADVDQRVRSRACFFAANAASNGNSWILDELLMLSDNQVVTVVREVEAGNIDAVEHIVNTIFALVEHNRAKLIDMYPELKNELSQLAARCDSQDLSDTVLRCAAKLR